jgi:hypothetical protein
MPQATPGTPQWFHDTLYKRLVERQAELEFFDAYYRGDHPLPWLAPQAREEFRRLVRMTRSNYMGLVCDAVAERASVEGFRFGDAPDSDDDTFRIFQANNLDSDFDQGVLESLIGGASYLMAAPNPADPATPHVWVEHASQVIVGYEPGTNRRVRKASLKVWDDEWTGEIHSTLYLMVDGQLFLFKHKAKAERVNGAVVDASGLRWEPREVAGEAYPVPGNMTAVPHVEMPNNPRLLTGGVSELYDLTDIQDRINKTIFDRMQTQEFGVDPQKYASAFPNEDDDGNPNTVEFGRNRMVTTDIAETRFGNFAVAPLDPLSAAKREDVKDIASRSRTPAQYLLGEMSNVNGETLKAAESGLVSKVRQRTRPWGEALEETMRMARTLAGLSTPADARMETIWSDPQYRTVGEMADAAVKLKQAGLTSTRQAQRDIGYSQTTIDQIASEMADERVDPVLGRIAEGLTNASADLGA